MNSTIRLGAVTLPGKVVEEPGNVGLTTYWTWAAMFPGYDSGKSRIDAAVVRVEFDFVPLVILLIKLCNYCVTNYPLCPSLISKFTAQGPSELQ